MPACHDAAGYKRSERCKEVDEHQSVPFYVVFVVMPWDFTVDKGRNKDERCGSKIRARAHGGSNTCEHHGFAHATKTTPTLPILWVVALVGWAQTQTAIGWSRRVCSGTFSRSTPSTSHRNQHRVVKVSLPPLLDNLGGCGEAKDMTALRVYNGETCIDCPLTLPSKGGSSA